MITKVWLKDKTKSKDAIGYPDCYPNFWMPRPSLPHRDIVNILDVTGKIHSTWLIVEIARIEFRP